MGGSTDGGFKSSTKQLMLLVYFPPSKRNGNLISTYFDCVLVVHSDPCIPWMLTGDLVSVWQSSHKHLSFGFQLGLPRTLLVVAFLLAKLIHSLVKPTIDRKIAIHSSKRVNLSFA